VVDVNNRVWQQLVRISVVKVIHVVEKFRHVIYWDWRWVLRLRRSWHVFSQVFVIAVVGFSKCKSFHLSLLYEYPPHATCIL